IEQLAQIAARFSKTGWPTVLDKDDELFEWGTTLSFAEESLRQADIAAARHELTEQVRRQPADPRLRVFLSQLLMVTGEWERARTQLGVAAELDAAAIPMRQIYSDAIGC